MERSIIESQHPTPAWLAHLGQPVASRLLAWEQAQADALEVETQWLAEQQRVAADWASAQAKAEALARTLEQAPIQFGDWSAPLHLSYGVCEIPHEGEPEAIVAQADAAMFIRKRERQTG